MTRQEMKRQEEAISWLRNRILTAKNLFDKNGKKWKDYHELDMQEIDGALSMLCRMTGKEYYVTDDGKLQIKGGNLHDNT